MRDLKDRIIARIRARGRGEVHVTKDFLDLGGRAAVDKALSRLVKVGTIRRIGRGLFDYPRTNPKLGIQLTPNSACFERTVCSLTMSGPPTLRFTSRPAAL